MVSMVSLIGKIQGFDALETLGNVGQALIPGVVVGLQLEFGTDPDQVAQLEGNARVLAMQALAGTAVRLIVEFSVQLPDSYLQRQDRLQSCRFYTVWVISQSYPMGKIREHHLLTMRSGM